MIIVDLNKWIYYDWLCFEKQVIIKIVKKNLSSVVVVKKCDFDSYLFFICIFFFSFCNFVRYYNLLN